MQPFRNSALVMPGPKTIHEVRLVSSQKSVVLVFSGRMMNAAVAGKYLQLVVIVQFVREPSLSLVCVTITVVTTTRCNRK